MARRTALARGQERRTLLLVLAATVAPTLAAALLFAFSVKPSLDDLIPARKSVDGFVLLDWAALVRDPAHGLDADSALQSGTAVRALGYLETEAPVRRGEPVSRFVLLPDAGNLLHPAHRFGDQMIGVELQSRQALRVKPGGLVWASGTFHALAGDAAGARPLYTLTDAEASPATAADIRTYFHQR